MKIARLRRHFSAYALFLVVLAFLCAFLIWPIVLTVNGGFRTPAGELTGAYLIGLADDPLVIEGLANSLLIAACVTTLCLLITLPLALLATRYDFPGKALLTASLLIPLILPPFVGAIGLRALLGRFGAVNALLGWTGLVDANRPGVDFLGGGFWSVVVMEALHLYPILYLNVAAALANVDPALDEAAVGLGAGRWRRFARITMPLIIPGLFAGSTIVFIWSFTELGTPLMFDYTTVTPVQIFWGVMEAEHDPRPYALVVVMLTVAVALYLLGRMVFGGRAYEMKSKASIAAGTRRLRGVRGWASSSLFVAVTGLAVVPHFGVVVNSFAVGGTWYRSILPRRWTLGNYEDALGHPLAMDSIANSMLYASLAMVVCLCLGFSISYLVVRVRIRGAAFLDGLAMLPLAVPGLVMAFGYVAMTLSWPFGTDGPWRHLASVVGPQPNPVGLLVIAYAVRRLPYVVRAATAGLQQTSVELEEAALNLGASRVATIRRIAVPLIMANLIAGAILAFSFSMLEVSDSLILAQKQQHFPITKAIYELFGRLGDGPYIASAMGVWAMALLAVTLVGAAVLMGRKLGVMFRI